MTTGPSLNVSVALIVFNRPSHAETVFSAAAAVRPRKLFLVADGPRAGHPTDAAWCQEVREDPAAGQEQDDLRIDVR